MATKLPEKTVSMNQAVTCQVAMICCIGQRKCRPAIQKTVQRCLMLANVVEPSCVCVPIAKTRSAGLCYQRHNVLALLQHGHQGLSSLEFASREGKGSSVLDAHALLKQLKHCHTRHHQGIEPIPKVLEEEALHANLTSVSEHATELESVGRGSSVPLTLSTELPAVHVIKTCFLPRL